MVLLRLMYEYQAISSFAGLEEAGTLMDSAMLTKDSSIIKAKTHPVDHQLKPKASSLKLLISEF